MSRIVVGVDPSDNARRALRWAVDESRLRGSHLQVVHAVARPDVLALPAVPDLPSHEELVAAGERFVEDLIASTDARGLTVSWDVQVRGVSELLCANAQGADLLVVGTRGMGGFRGLLLGSVTQQVVAHSPCPVVAVSDATDRPPADVGSDAPTA